MRFTVPWYKKKACHVLPLHFLSPPTRENIWSKCPNGNDPLTTIKTVNVQLEMAFTWSGTLQLVLHFKEIWHKFCIRLAVSVLLTLISEYISF